MKDGFLGSGMPYKMGMILSIAAGGALGAVLRYAVITLTPFIFAVNFPMGTLLVNILGSFLMGLFIAYFAVTDYIQPELKAFLTMGMLGAFTTFSAFSYDIWTMWEKGDIALAFAYGAASVLLSITAIFLGVMLMRHLMA